jgi:alpha 1,2-mannosyltransferase
MLPPSLQQGRDVQGYLRAWLGKAKYLALAIPLFLNLAYFLNRYSSYLPRLPSSSSTHLDPSNFWTEVFAALEDVRPSAGPVKPNGGAPAEEWSPDVDHPRANLTVMTPEDESALRASHASFVDSLPDLSRRLPFDPETTGIVTTAGAPNFGQAVTMILMVRQSGSTLPVQIVLDSTTPWIDSHCAGALQAMNVTCLRVSDIWARLEKPAPELFTFQWKVISLLASPFQNILFLDADTLPVLNPDTILAPGSQPLASTGLITWPDFWTSSASHLFYAIAGDIDPPLLAARTTSESGILVVDKARHADTLLLALYYNFYGPNYYYPLLSQGAPGQGDKETYLQAALVLEALGKRKSGLARLAMWKDGSRSRFWDVKTLPKVHGRSATGGMDLKAV